MPLVSPLSSGRWVAAMLLTLVVLSTMSLSGASVAFDRWRARHAGPAPDAPNP